ncbi:putative membrane protein [Natronincola peptidivorans]|uniref:Putative membrane protein n=1 Tax=Natronincola peptidivorans TaxID=426128 RepID=A0A1I0CDE2_9FIRM|nr:phage holin family protein [Natronincola peptidivorans]SET17442.1 putative membrane protein [Natronincola peptidivorans]
MAAGRDRYRRYQGKGRDFLGSEKKMQRQQLKLLANILGVYLMATVFSFIEASGITQIILFGVILWLINLILRPLLLLITLPINMITLGIFTLVINTWMIMLADTIMRGVHISGFWLSLLLAMLIMALNRGLKKLF